MFDNILRYMKGLKICYVCKQELDMEMFCRQFRGYVIFRPPTHKSCYDCRLKKAKEMGNALMVIFPYDIIEKMKKR